jgi:predicted nuclease with TOPRIM domain
MGKLSTPFGILAAILAIAAAALSFWIAGRRTEFRQRADMLATAVATMVQKMDAQSNTSLGNQVSFTAATDSAPESGSLGWKAFSEAKDDAGTYGAYQEKLDMAIKLSADLNQQRNDLAEALDGVGSRLNLPETELDVAALRDLSDQERFGKALNTVTGHVTAVANRDEALIDTITKAANEIGHPIDEQALTQRETSTDENGEITLGDYPYRIPLNEFGMRITGLKTRADEYADTLAEAVARINKHDWETNADAIKDEREYGAALTSLLNDYDDINEKLALYEKAKIQIEEQKERIKGLVNDLDETRDKLDKTQDELTSATAELRDLRRIVTGRPDVGFGTEEIDPNLEGEILEVNPEWNYVILGLGRKDQVQENMKMLVARDDKLIAKLLVSKVMGTVSIAEILPEINTGAVKVGDRVILPSAQN